MNLQNSMASEQLPDNLYWEFSNSDDDDINNETDESNKRILTQCFISNLFKWGPYDDIELNKCTGLTDDQIWTNIDVNSSESEWVLVLIDRVLQLSCGNDSYNSDDTNVKVVFNKSENKIWVETKMELAVNTELKAELEIIENNNSFCIKKEMNSEESMSEDNDLNVQENQSTSMDACKSTTNDTTTTSTTTTSTTSTNNNSSIGSKTCTYCGINFTHQCTLEAHMAYYCARRQVDNGLGTPNSVNKQKTWRTRQRNRPNPSNNQSSKIFNGSDVLSTTASLIAAASNPSLFNEDNLHKLNLLDPSVAAVAASLHASRNAMNSQQNGCSNTNPLSTKNNPVNNAVAAAAILSNFFSSVNSTPISSSPPNILNTNIDGDGADSGGELMSPPIRAPPSNLMVPGAQQATTQASTHLHHPPPLPSQQGPHHNIQHPALPFCNTCGIYFANQEMYENHMGLDINVLKNVPSKMNKLVLAAPVLGQNGFVHYVPVHNFRQFFSNNNQPSNINKSGVDESVLSSPLDLSIPANNSRSPLTSSNTPNPLLQNKLLLNNADLINEINKTIASNTNNNSNNTNTQAHVPPAPAPPHAPPHIDLETAINQFNALLANSNRVNINTSGLATQRNVSSSNSVQVQQQNPTLNNNNNDNLTRKYLCQHCQTRFQLYSTFQAHQEYYCQGKRKSTGPPEKRPRLSSVVPTLSVLPTNPPPPLASSPIQPNSTSSNSDNNNNSDNSTNNGLWDIVVNGFKCNYCGFIGQTRRGIRIHCKNQCPYRKEKLLLESNNNNNNNKLSSHINDTMNLTNSSPPPASSNDQNNSTQKSTLNCSNNIKIEASEENINSSNNLTTSSETATADCNKLESPSIECKI